MLQTWSGGTDEWTRAEQSYQQLNNYQMATSGEYGNNYITKIHNYETLTERAKLSIGAE